MAAPAFLEEISANRAARLEIADFMKAEAGVTAHDVNERREDLSGLAWFNTGNIRAPEGRRLVELSILAHECGHVFLHGPHDPVGNAAPSHIKEWEAEAYTAQCFEVYRLRIPKDRLAWGRDYVRAHIDADRAAGIAIDPRAEAYADGTRSPFAPLRRVPATWHAAGLIGIADVQEPVITLKAENATSANVTAPTPASRPTALARVGSFAWKVAMNVFGPLAPRSKRTRVSRPFALQISKEAVFFTVLQPVVFTWIALDYAKRSHAVTEVGAWNFGLVTGLTVGLLGGLYIAFCEAHSRAEIDAAWAWFKLTALPRAVFLIALLTPTIADA